MPNMMFNFGMICAIAGPLIAAAGYAMGGR